ncbi:MAG: pirin family protein [Burkholderiales bacterium]|nr:pirin family protein [Burkholderiales bacterium]
MTMALLKPHVKDIGGLEVRRLLPGHPHKMVGPFVFFDHMGPADFAPGHGIDVRPHPHIGLATVTYLFEGAIMHRDSLGFVQRIEPGAVNWMTAGEGIVHSERTAPEDRKTGSRLHGIQTWVALPKTHEQTVPTFSHHPKESLPVITQTGVAMHLIVGSAFGRKAPTPAFSEIFYLAAEMDAEATFDLPPEYDERAVYIVEGKVRIAGSPVAPLHLAVLPPGEPVRIEAASAARLMMLGGAKMDGDRIIWWNFVASSRELIEDAKTRWREQRFAPVPGETELIPLPER